MKPKLITTMTDYTIGQFRADTIAGLTVALVAFPLSIAIAIASGAAPITGLITAIIAGFFISALGGSRVQIGGPTGAFIVIVYAIIHQHGFSGLVAATLMAGFILLIAGFLRAGRLIKYIPEPVIDGFTIGIAIIIAFSQIKDLAGLDGPALPAEFIPKLEGLWALRASFNPISLLMGISSVAAILLLRAVKPKIPWLIIVVAVASLAAHFFLPSVETVESHYGALPFGMPSPHWPEISLRSLPSLLPAAMTIAFLAAIESLLSAVVGDRMIGASHRSNAELIAQGVANIASSLFGGLPATGAIARTATNVNAGGRTPVAGIIHALIILLALLVAGHLAGAMALPALAALLIVTAWTMSEPHRWAQRLAQDPINIFLLLLTAVLTILVDLTIAISVGTALGLAAKFARDKGFIKSGPLAK